MGMLKDKDWRWKVALDKQKSAEVANFANLIKDKKSANALRSELAFFKKYYSIEAVLLIIESSTEQVKKDAKKYIEKNISGLMFIPKELEEYYKRIIEKFDPDDQAFLHKVLNKGLNSKTFAPNKVYYKVVLGKFYNAVIAKCNKYASQYKHNISLRELKEYEISTSLNELKKRINTSVPTLKLWGEQKEEDYLLKYNNSYGFGKFRSKVTTNLENTFTVNCPDHKITEEDLHIQYLSNVYPGYGHFAMSQFGDTTGRNIDFGANFVINGWSMFASLHIFPSLYTKNVKIINAKIIKLLLEKPSEKNFKRIYQMLINTYTPSVAIKIFKQITQQVGKFESRFLGALATEILIDKGFALNPNNYLSRLAKLDITNYFTTMGKLK